MRNHFLKFKTSLSRRGLLWRRSAETSKSKRAPIQFDLTWSFGEVRNATFFVRQKGVETVKKYKFAFFLFITALFCSSTIFAHTINYALEREPPGLVIGYYLKLGFQHIIPSGLDHILFVSALCLLSTRIKTILWQATAFTVAHSVTLALSMKNIIVVPSAITEPIIALSIMFVAIENILFSELKPWRVLIVFMFGLIHGIGFASALNEIGLPPNKFYTSILAFNGGVELGQMAIIILMFSSIVALWGKKDWYRLRIVYPISIVIAGIAAYWTVQRLFC